MYSCFIINTRTGVIQSPVFPSAAPWQRVINAMGQGSATFPWAVPLASRLDYKAVTHLWEHSIIIERNDVPIYWGVIYSRKWDDDTHTLTVQHADIRLILAMRTTFGSNGYSGDTADGKLALINKTLAHIAPWVIWAGTLGPTDNYDLPIHRSEDGGVDGGVGGGEGTDSRTYYDFDIDFVEKSLEELQNADGGPDIDFQPMRADDGSYYLQMLCGTPDFPQLGGPVIDFNMSAPKPTLYGVSVTEDGSKMSTSAYAVGVGSEADMKVKWARVDTVGPALDRVGSYKQIDDLVILQSHADADLATYSTPTEQWTVSMLASESIGIENMPLGSTLRLYYRGHPWITDGWHEQRVIGISGDLDEEVKFSLQPTGGGS